MPILINFFLMFNESHAVASPQICDVMSLDLDKHNVSCCGTISLFIWSRMMHVDESFVIESRIQ